MPLLSVIPYVSDLFDPGVYVFQGNTFSHDGVLVELDTTNFYLLDDFNFNSNAAMVSILDRSYYDFPDQDIETGFIDYIPIFVDGLQFDVTFNPSTKTPTSWVTPTLNKGYDTLNVLSILSPSEIVEMPNVGVEANGLIVEVDSQYVMTRDEMTLSQTVISPEGSIMTTVPGDEVDSTGQFVVTIEGYQRYVLGTMSDVTSTEPQVVQRSDQNIIASASESNELVMRSIDSVVSLSVGSFTDETQTTNLTFTM